MNAISNGTNGRDIAEPPLQVSGRWDEKYVQRLNHKNKLLICQHKVLHKPFFQTKPVRWLDAAGDDPDGDSINGVDFYHD
jgi:hypothetical protein